MVYTSMCSGPLIYLLAIQTTLCDTLVKIFQGSSKIFMKIFKDPYKDLRNILKMRCQYLCRFSRILPRSSKILPRSLRIFKDLQGSLTIHWGSSNIFCGSLKTFEDPKRIFKDPWKIFEDPQRIFKHPWEIFEDL